MSAQASIAGVASASALALLANASVRGGHRPKSRSLGSAGELFRINLTYLVRHGQLPNLACPRLFNELVQLRKLTDRDARLPRLADKVLVKHFVADRLGDDWVVPTLWQGPELPAVSEWSAPIVVKSRHGCNQCIFLRSDDHDWSSVVRRANGWTSARYGFWLDEWLYSQIKPGVLVEPFIGDGQELPIDYKLFVFGGHVEYVQVHLGRERRHRWIVFDRCWTRLTPGDHDLQLSRPKSLSRMIDAAETLALGFDFVRVDMYEINERPLFGEMTFYPGSGLGSFSPRSLDAAMGAHWLAALHERTGLTVAPDREIPRSESQSRGRRLDLKLDNHQPT